MNKKEDSKWAKFKNNWKNERFRSFFMLGFWLLFAAIIILSYRPSYNNAVKSYQENKTNEVNSVLMRNYSFTLIDTKNDQMTITKGKVYNEYKTFTINNVEYYYNGQIYKMNEPVEKVTMDMAYMNITPKLINEMIKKSNLIETNIYELPLTDFLTIYNPDELANLSASSLQNKNVKITVFKNEGLFSKVDIDITEYTKLKESVTSNILTFNYMEINKLEDFTKEYESRVRI